MEIERNGKQAEIDALKLENLQLRQQNLELKSQRDYFQQAYGTVVGSQAWKMTAPLRKFLDFLKRFWLFRWLYRKLKALRAGKMTVSDPHLDPHLDIERPSEKPLPLSSYKKLKVPPRASPTVSIVIPVYNQFDYTYHCVKSILKNSGEISYEIIIADDCSTDHTQAIDKVISGLKTIHNEKNLRFLRNCNHAAKETRGEYILFLNNDTQVQPNWLSELVKLISSDPKIGMVGSKLVYPDGRLQEAGGILWKDGSAWNYGRMQDASLPEYNYVKEADYISGAAIMIRRSLWEEIGGFDERFAPAYCEDSDLAFEVRRHGYKVMYQPASVVVHFEGISNGTDTSTGQKSYQVVNQKKFCEKWASELAKHPINGENVFQARDRSYDKPCLLMVDHFVPTFDKDCGSRTVYEYLKLFASSGYSVKFIGDNFAVMEPYTSALEQLGIEVLYGPYYQEHWKEWICEAAPHLPYVWLNRPHVSVNYIDFIRANTDAKIIYYGHDLCYFRELREYEITKDPATLQHANEIREIEYSLMKTADKVYYPSQVELEEIHKEAPEIDVGSFPIFVFEPRTWPGYDAASRKDLMFIGGFNHHPNADAVLWFVREAFPKVLKAIPNVKLHIVGSNAPEEILRLANKNIIVDGFVSDERLEELYASCRVSVSPLRYGAGIKGKVIEALYHNVPVVTTSIGAEGIADAESVMMIADSAEDYADAVIRLYTSDELLKKYSEKSCAYVNQYYSPQCVKDAIRDVLPFED